MPVQTAIQVRRGTASSWTSTNPTLAAGEIGFETDTSKFKIGTGSTAWNSLNYFAQDPVTTKGDLYTFSTTDARLAVGNNGETLVADSSATTGLRWSAGNAVGNPVLNSAFQVWQRGTSISVAANTSPYVADRWQALTQTNQATTISRQSTNDTTNLPSIQYCARIQRNSGQTGTSVNAIYNTFESSNSIPYAGKTVTMSFYARAGANYSPTSSILIARLVAGTGTDQNVYVGFTNSGFVIDQNATLTTTWQRFSYTGTVGTSATQLAIGFAYNWTGTAGANDWFEVTGVQIDVGSVALPFRTNGATLAGELAACQRYYQRFTSDNVALLGFAIAQTAANAYGVMNLKATMRATPTTLDISGLRLTDTNSGFTPTTAFAIYAAGSTKDFVSLSSLTFTGLTTARAYIFELSSSAGFVGFGAEL